MAGMVIIGAGESGVRAAFALRESGYTGAVTLLSDEPHLPYERPPLSKSGSEAKPIVAPERFADAEIDLRRGVRAASISTAGQSVTLSDGSLLAYDALLLATGASPRQFASLAGTLSLRTLEDAARIHDGLAPGRTIAIVGGGFIGLELAAVARMAGAAVTVFEAGPRLMGRAVPAEIGAEAQARHQAEGVEIILNAEVERADQHTVSLKNGRVIAADCVIAGVGASPNVALAAAAGLAVENGIVVDGSFRTSDPHVFATGDCCAFPYRGRHVRLESWRAAQDHAVHAARAMLGDATPYAKVPWFWSDQYDLTLQVAGLPEAGRAGTRRDLADGFILFERDADGVLSAAAGIGTGNAVAKDIRLAEMIIERGIRPDPAALADASVNLKSLLKG